MKNKRKNINYNPLVFCDTTSERHTLTIKLDSESGKNNIPPIPEGNDKQKAKIGDYIVTTETAILKAGLRFQVKDVWCDNGYFHYVAGGVVHRSQDIEIIK